MMQDGAITSFVLYTTYTTQRRLTNNN